jgi:hypothetical protein
LAGAGAAPAESGIAVTKRALAKYRVRIRISLLLLHLISPLRKAVEFATTEIAAVVASRVKSRKIW